MTYPTYYIRQKQRGWFRKKYLVELKGGKCEKCGYAECLRALSFHHLDPKIKSFNLDIRNIGNKKWNIVLDEAEKCSLLCVRCHWELHDSETNQEYLTYESRYHKSEQQICLNCGHEFQVKASRLKIGGGKYCSTTCANVAKRKTIRPSKEELKILLWKLPTTKIAESYGVSDKAVSKWAKKYRLVKPPRGYWSSLVNK